jgi:hypothetical protein
VSEVLYEPPSLVVYPLDLPPLRTDDSDSAGFYLAVTTPNSTERFRGAILFSSDESEGNFIQTGLVPDVATAGTTDTVLGVASVGVWDLINTVDVTLTTGSLSSKTPSEVLAGGNIAYINGEILGFQEAELIGTNQYRLSKLLRGLRDTEDFISLHTLNDPFVLLDESGLTFHRLNQSAIETYRTLRIVPVGSVVEDTPTTSVYIRAATLRPFAPAMLRMNKDYGTGTIELTWSHRTRDLARVLSLNVPNADQEVYTVAILKDNRVKRTVTVTGAQSYDWTSSDRTSDGVTVDVGLTFKVTQISATVGPGRTAVSREFDFDL